MSENESKTQSPAVKTATPPRLRDEVSFRGRPWAIRREVLPAIAAHLRGEGVSPDLEAAYGQPVQQNAPRGVMVISLRGVITPGASLLSYLTGGGGGLAAFRKALADAVSNDEVSTILLNVDSPGGIVDLVPETAADIRAARKVKPVVAVANTCAGSAAYWLASQADELVVTPSGEVGSIGVFCMHEDWSGMNERIGIDPTYVYAGKYKVEANPDEPLSDEARAAIQERIDERYADFIADVALGRGTTAAKVDRDFGQGRMLLAQDAVKAGLADRVATLEETIQAALKPGRRSGPGARIRKALPALSADDGEEVAWEDAAYSMALLMGGRGAGAFADLPGWEHRALYDEVAAVYRAGDHEPPPYERAPTFTEVSFQHDERAIFRARYLGKTLDSLTAGLTGFDGALPAETRAKADEALAKLRALLGSPKEDALALMRNELASATNTIKEATDARE